MNLSYNLYVPYIGKLFKKILPKKMVIPILIGRLKGTKWIIGSSVLECALGSYEYKKRKLFEQKISKSNVVYDIGANVGFYTILASKLVGFDGKIISFEPNPQNLKYLKKHIELNQCSNVIVMEAAVSDKSGKSSFFQSSDSMIGHLSDDGKLRVDTISLDDYILEGKIPIPDYIKIDVEGAELLVLKGAKSMLTKYNIKIFLATHPHRVSNVHRDCCNFLEYIGYKLKPIDDNHLYKSREIFAYKDNNLLSAGIPEIKMEKGK